MSGNSKATSVKKGRFNTFRMAPGEVLIDGVRYYASQLRVSYFSPTIDMGWAGEMRIGNPYIDKVEFTLDRPFAEKIPGDVIQEIKFLPWSQEDGPQYLRKGIYNHSSSCYNSNGGTNTLEVIFHGPQEDVKEFVGEIEFDVYI